MKSRRSGGSSSNRAAQAARAGKSGLPSGGQEALSASERLLRQSERIAGVGGWEWDRARDEFTFSEGCARLLGLKDRLSRTAIATVAHPDDLPAVRQAFADALAGTRPYDDEFRVVRPDNGEVRHVHLRAEVVRNPAGEPIHMYGAIQDITVRRRAETALRESEERFRATFEQAAVGIAHATPEGRFLRVNRRFAEIVGYTLDELQQLTIQQLTYADDLPAELRVAQRLLAGEIDTFSVEKRYVRKNGTLVWVSLTVSLARDAQNQCAYAIGVVQEISARKEAERARDEAEQRFTRIFENVNAVAIIVSSDECLTYCNPYLLKLTGWSHNEVLGRNWFEVFVPVEDRERVHSVFLSAMHGGEFPYHYENEICARDGERRLVSWNNTALHDAAGHTIGVASLGYDITDQRRAEEAVRLERARLRSILETMEDAVCIIDPEHRFTYVNPAFVRRFGDGWDRPCHELFHDRAAPCPECKIPAVFAGQSVTREQQHEKSGRTFEVFDTPLQDQDGNTLRLEILHDITAHKEAQLGLAQRKRELETLTENAPDMIVRLNRKLQYVFVNRLWSELMGVTLDAAIGKSARELGLPDALGRLAEEVYSLVFADRQMRAVEICLPTTKGVRDLQMRIVPELGPAGGKPQTILIIARDVTEQKRLQEELIQAQKLEVVGRLAAGIAHDINNVLMAVSGYAALARRELAAGHPALENLAALERTVVEAGALSKGLLTFSHREPAHRVPLDLQEVLRDAEHLLRRLLPASINLVCEVLTTEPLWILGDATQMRQVILNLAVNARDAMPAGGNLSIKLEAIKGPSSAPKRKGVTTARLTISDSGTGMTAEVLARVFEPFFTTKPRGHGAGLGLAIVKSIVESHDGQIELSSGPATGTALVIHLPCIEPPHVSRCSEPRAGASHGRGESILVADDNAQVLEILSAGLRQTGYQPLQATDAPSALALFAGHADRIRLLILDYDMPGGTGLDVLHKIRRVKATLPALLISGELDRDLDDAYDEHTRIIRKPFRLDDLMEQVTGFLTQNAETEAS